MGTPPQQPPGPVYYPQVVVLPPPPGVVPPKKGVSTLVIVVIVVVIVVAVLVVLALVLSVLVSGFVMTGGNGPRTIGVNISRDSNGNYSMKIVQSLSGLTAAGTKLTSDRGGSVLVASTSFNALDCAGEGAVFTKLGTTGSNLEAGDFVQLIGKGNTCSAGGAPGNQFTVGDNLEISDSGGILWSGRIN